jgi:hypothetical protein
MIHNRLHMHKSIRSLRRNRRCATNTLAKSLRRNRRCATDTLANSATQTAVRHRQTHRDTQGIRNESLCVCMCLKTMQITPDKHMSIKSLRRNRRCATDTCIKIPRRKRRCATERQTHRDTTSICNECFLCACASSQDHAFVIWHPMSIRSLRQPTVRHRRV